MEERSSRPGRLSARAVGALAAGGIVAAAIAILVVLRPFDIDPSRVMERPEIFLGFIVVATGLGWWAGRIASSRGSLRAIGVGAAFGASLWPAFVVLAILVSTIDAVLRGTAGPLQGLGVAIVWGLYGTIVLSIISVVTVPMGSSGECSPWSSLDGCRRDQDDGEAVECSWARSQSSRSSAEHRRRSPHNRPPRRVGRWAPAPWSTPPSRPLETCSRSRPRQTRTSQGPSC